MEVKQRTLGFVLSIIFIPFAVGCVSVNTHLMPSESEQREKGTFESLEQVKDAFKWVPLDLKVEDLSVYGFGSKQGKTTVAPHLKIRGFLTGTSQNGQIKEKMPEAVEKCIDAGEYCALRIVEDGKYKSKGVGNIFSRLIQLKKVDAASGWSFKAYFLFNKGRLVYKTIETTSDPTKITDRRNPLGPLQELRNF